VQLAHQDTDSFGVGQVAGRVPEIELCQVPVQVHAGDMVVGAVDGPLALREECFDGVGATAVGGDVFAAAVVGRFVRACFFTDVGVAARAVRVKVASRPTY